MDSDILILGDMSGLFGCGSFCAMFIDPCIFNSGIMVITPSTVLFNDLVENMGQIDSYDGADLGYFNGIFLFIACCCAVVHCIHWFVLTGYFSELYEAPLFNPEKGGNTLFDNAHFDPTIVKTWTPLPKEQYIREYKKRIRRLPYRYHSDHKHLMYQGVFHPCKRPQAIEMLGAAKPWLWWTYPISDYSWRWYEIRKKLPHYGEFWFETVFSISILFKLLVPLGAIWFILRKFKNSHSHLLVVDTTLPQSESESEGGDHVYDTHSFRRGPATAFSFFQRHCYQILCVVVGFMVLYFSFKLGWNVTPLHLDPYTSWLIFWEWFTVAALLLSAVGCLLVSILTQRSHLLKQSMLNIQNSIFNTNDLSGSSALMQQTMQALPKSIQNWTLLVVGWGVFSVYFLSVLSRLMTVRIVGKLTCTFIVVVIFISLYLIAFYKVNRTWSLKRNLK
jgi:hypothetical protein